MYVVGIWSERRLIKTFEFGSAKFVTNLDHFRTFSVSPFDLYHVATKIRPLSGIEVRNLIIKRVMTQPVWHILTSCIRLQLVDVAKMFALMT